MKVSPVGFSGNRQQRRHFKSTHHPGELPVRSQKAKTGVRLTRSIQRDQFSTWSQKIRRRSVNSIPYSMLSKVVLSCGRTAAP